MKNQPNHLSKNQPNYSLDEEVSFTIEHQELIELQQNIHVFINKELDTSKANQENIYSIKQYWKPWEAIAATVLLFLSMGYVFFYTNTSLNKKATLAKRYYSLPTIELKHEILILKEISATPPTHHTQKWKHIIEYYDTQNYKECNILLTELIKENPAMKIAYFYRAHTLYVLEEYDKAVLDFIDVVENASGTSLINLSKWYLALTYINLDKIVEAKVHLQELSMVKIFSEDAKNLLSELE